MNILLTGATGYLGSHLARSFVAAGHNVTILKRSTSNIRRISDLHESLVSFDSDLCRIEKPFLERGPFDAVVHAATSYGRQGESAAGVLRSNTIFALELLEAACSFGTGCFLNSSTFFLKARHYGYLNSYCLSKKQFSEWGEQFGSEGRIRFIDAQLEHIYGPDDDSSKFVSFIVRSCLSNVPSIPLTLGEKKRDFIYIDDVVTACCLILEHEAHQGAAYKKYEIGSGESVQIRYFVELIHKLSHAKSILDFGAIPYRDNEIEDSSADISPLHSLGWKPRYSLEEGLTDTIDKERIVLSS